LILGRDCGKNTLIVPTTNFSLEAPLRCHSPTEKSTVSFLWYAEAPLSAKRGELWPTLCSQSPWKSYVIMLKKSRYLIDTKVTTKGLARLKWLLANRKQKKRRQLLLVNFRNIVTSRNRFITSRNSSSQQQSIALRSACFTFKSFAQFLYWFCEEFTRLIMKLS
jgi:hypothetical protein